MIKTKELSTVNIVMFLTMSLVVAAGLITHRPQAAAPAAPVFVGETVTVHKVAARSVPVARILPIVKALAEAPAPQPKAVPLPIFPPTITYSVLPVYPVQALADGREGVVLLSVYIGLSGRPERIETRSSSGSADLDNAAAQAVAQWQFSPAAQGGQALASWFEVPVRFVIK